jgi:hypothetical protein
VFTKVSKTKKVQGRVLADGVSGQAGRRLGDSLLQESFGGNRAEHAKMKMTSNASSTTERTVLGPPSMSVVVYEGSVLYAVGDESWVAGAGLCFSDTSVLLFSKASVPCVVVVVVVVVVYCWLGLSTDSWIANNTV